MRITNIHTEPLGFDAERLLPGRTIDTNFLPKGFNENHPLIKFYIRRGWLEVAGSSASGNERPVSINVHVGVNTNGDSNIGDVDGGTGKNDTVAAAKSTQSKPISRLNKTELRTLASELGIEFPKDIGNPALREKIKAAQKTVAEDESLDSLPEAGAEANTDTSGSDAGCDNPDD